MAKKLADLEQLKGANIAQRSTGNLYQVDLPDEAIGRMLNWDAPLSAQSEHVVQALRKSRRKLSPSALEDLGGDLSLLYGKDVTPDESLGTMKSLGGNPAFGEAMLQRLGVPGVRYLDQGSRVGGKGTSNYVVFPGEEQLLRILRRE